MRPAEECAALQDRKSVRSQDDAALEKRIARAVDDVMTGGVLFSEAARNRQVPEGRLRAALVSAGWQSRVKSPPGPRRRTFGNGKRHGT